MTDDSSSSSSNRASNQNASMRRKVRGKHLLLLIFQCLVAYIFLYDEKTVSYFRNDLQLLNANTQTVAQQQQDNASSKKIQPRAHDAAATPGGQYFLYVITLQGVEGADNTNDHRLDDFRRHWSILCGAEINNIQIRRCPGKLNPPNVHRGYSLSLAYIDCIDQAMEENHLSSEEPFIFLEDDARLFNSNFCHASYRKRLYDSVPANATLLMLGGHDMKVYDETHIPNDPDLPILKRPEFGAGSYGFVIINQERLEYFRRKLVKMTNRTLDKRSMFTFKAIDRQFYLYPMLKSYMPIPWIVYHEGGLYSNTKGIVRGEFGDGSKQYRWVPGLTGSFKNCTTIAPVGDDYDVDPSSTNIADTISGTVKVSCGKLYYRLSATTLRASSNNSIVVGVVSNSGSDRQRQVCLQCSVTCIPEHFLAHV